MCLEVRDRDDLDMQDTVYCELHFHILLPENCPDERDELAKHQCVTGDGPRFVHFSGLGKHGRLLNSLS